MNLFHLVVICLTLASLVGVPKPASAISYKFASQTGTPADACTYTDPCNLQQAVDTSSDGGFVFVAEGIYHPYALPSDQVLLITRMSIFMAAGMASVVLIRLQIQWKIPPYWMDKMPAAG